MAGVKYQCNPKTVVRAKVNSQGVLSACATNKCADKMSVTVTSQVREKGGKHAFKYVTEFRCEMPLGGRGRQPWKRCSGVYFVYEHAVLRAVKREGVFCRMRDPL